jgi:hypothetical protein
MHVRLAQIAALPFGCLLLVGSLLLFRFQVQILLPAAALFPAADEFTAADVGQMVQLAWGGG